MTVTEIRHLFEYTDWANGLALSAAEAIPSEHLRRDVGISHVSILGTLLHMAAADSLWVERWRGNSQVGDVWAGWRPDAAESVQQIRERWQPITRKRDAFLAGLVDADLDKEFQYRRFNGDLYSLPLVQQLLHLVNHATLHRGQVVGLIRQLGIEPPTTDLLFYLMEMRRGLSKT